MLYGRITGLVLSLFLPAFYRHVARSWGGIGLLYLLLLFTLTWMPSLIKVHLTMQKFAQEDFPKFANKVPDISHKNGKFSSPVPQPLEIKDDLGNPVFVLDTTGRVNNLDQTRAMFLLTETRLHQRDEFGNIQIHDMTPFPDFELTKEWLQSWVDTVANWLAVGLFPVCMILSLLRAVTIMLLASLAGLMFNSAFNARVTYGGLLRFAAVGMTFSVYLDTGLGLAGISTPFFFWFFFALAFTTAYVGFGTFVSVPKLVDLDFERDADDNVDERESRRRGADYDDGYGPDHGGFKVDDRH